MTLTVKNAYGTDTATRAGLVTAFGKPKADFTANERRGVKPFTVNFTDLSTGNPTSWTWKFGDGTTSTERNPVHTYQKEGAYDVSLTVSNSYGTDTVTKTGSSPLVTPPVTTPGAAITPATQPQGTTAQVPQTATPGFEAVLALTGLATLVSLAKRR